MNTEPNPASELSPEELRREIAEALGYKEVADYFPVSDRTGYTLVDKDGKAVGHGYNYWIEGEAWGDCPDWPNDLAAALTLCLEIAGPERIIGIGKWFSGDCSAGLMVGPDNESTLSARADTPALALSRLAYEALRAKGGAK